MTLSYPTRKKDNHMMRAFTRILCMGGLLGLMLTLHGAGHVAAQDAGKPAEGTAPAAAPAPAPVPTPGVGTPNGTAPAGQPAANTAPLTPSRDIAAVKAMMVSLSYDKAEINSVLRFISMAGGVPIVSDSELKGTVTIISLQQIPLSQAFDAVGSALRARGYALIGDLDSKVIRVVPLKKVIAEPSSVNTGSDVEKIPNTDDIITQIIPLTYASATKMKTDLKPLVSDDQATLLAVSSTNSLVITDTANNVRRIVKIINALDKDTSDVIEVELYSCKNANADSLVEALGKIFQLARTPVGNPQPGQQPQPEGGGATNIRGDDGLISLKGEIRVTSDARTNTLIISAARQKIDLVMSVVKKLDVDTAAEVRSKVFQLQYADAKMVADQLGKLFEQPQGGAGGSVRMPWDYSGMNQPSTKSGYAGLKRNVIVSDVRTNSVIVTATEQNMRTFENMIKELDAPKVLSEVTRIFPLKYAKSSDLATSMNSLFRGNTRRTSFFDLFAGSTANQPGDPLGELKNITVVSDDKSNTLLITGPPKCFSLVEDMVKQLDQRSVQVFIEVAIVDVTLDNTTKFGVEWNWRSSVAKPDGTPLTSGGTNFDLSKETLGLKYSVLSNNLQALLHTLETRSNVKVYSTPSITTSDNIEAKISIGQDQPFVTSSQDTANGNPVRTTAYKNVSISLTVTPHVNGSTDLIAMDVDQTINEIVGQEAVLNAPIVANREAKTSVMVNDGQTIVIGGIIKDNRTRDISGVPLLDQIPLIGQLFKKNTWTNQKSELMVFLTPHILRTEDSVNDVTNAARGKLTDADPAAMKNIPGAKQEKEQEKDPKKP